MKNTFTILHIFCILAISCQSQTNENVSESKDSSIIEANISTIIEPQEKGKYKTVGLIPVPNGYKRIEADEDSFGFFLRNLELKTEDNKVYLHDGSLKWNQTAQFAVLKIDVGTADLQQCADAVMRLRAEYLYQQKQYNSIHFNFLSDGKPRYYKNYANGDYSPKKFRNYMNYIFSYANTASLKKELNKVNTIFEINIGDVFIQKGSPYGHAITVMDIAINETGERIFMLSQSYMPAQDIHILVNPSDKTISPWYRINSDGNLLTPQWFFRNEDLMRF